MKHNHLPALPNIAIVDPCSAAGYTVTDLDRGGLGGTEATILRVATALSSQFKISIYQNGRRAPQWSDAGRLLPMNFDFHATVPSAIIVINRWKVALKLRKLFPNKPIFLWLHIYPGRHNRKMGAALKAADVAVVCVSETHAKCLADFLNVSELPRITPIYNPLSEGLSPDGTPRDRNRLLFASSPHKGLKEVFRQFSVLRQSLPDLTLAVADPGYLRWDVGRAPEGTLFLGSLSHDALIRHMRRSLCLFYPQTTFAETFGLVLAEANAVGTPVLVQSGLGANDEIVRDAEQRIDGQDPTQILTRIEQWRNAQPNVVGNPDFQLNNVAARWYEILTRSFVTQARPLAEVG